MTEISRIKMPAAADDPESVFETPSEFGEHTGLTRGQKIAALESWDFIVCARIDAVSEGMTEHPEGAYSHDVNLQRQIQLALDHLETVAI